MTARGEFYRDEVVPSALLTRMQWRLQNAARRPERLLAGSDFLVRLSVLEESCRRGLGPRVMGGYSGPETSRSQTPRWYRQCSYSFSRMERAHVAVSGADSLGEWWVLKSRRTPPGKLLVNATHRLDDSAAPGLGTSLVYSATNWVKVSA